MPPEALLQADVPLRSLKNQGFQRTLACKAAWRLHAMAAPS
jgi:hypothetical protein